MKQAELEVKVGRHRDTLFNEKFLAEAKKHLEENGLSQNSIAAYAFERAVQNQKVAREKGATAVQDFLLMICLACTVRRNMGYSGDLYNLVVKIDGLSSN